MDWLLDPFAPSFMRYALAAGILAAITTALIGTWVVIRGMTFLGDALAHGILPGIAIAFLLGLDLTIGAIVGALVMTAGIAIVQRTGKLTADTGIGLLFVGMLALGVIIVSRLPSFTSSLTAFLFGDILGVRETDLLIIGGAAIVTVVALVAFHRAFLVLTFNEQKAELLGLRPRLAHVAMLALLSIAIVTAFRAVGTLLVFGLLVAPPATALLLARGVVRTMLVAVALGALSVVLGLLATWYLDTAAGATIAEISVLAFFAVLLALQGRGLQRPWPRRPAGRP